jgi:hypothetical protein
MDDPMCQEGLAGKIRRAINIHKVAYALLPDH